MKIALFIVKSFKSPYWIRIHLGTQYIGGIKMSKVIRVRITDELYESLEKLSKIQNKSISRLTAELLQSALKNEMKDAQLLNRMIQKIESLESQQHSDINIELFKQLLNQNTSILVQCLLALSNEFFFDKKKHENFVASVKEILQKIE